MNMHIFWVSVSAHKAKQKTKSWVRKKRVKKSLKTFWNFLPKAIFVFVEVVLRLPMIKLLIEYSIEHEKIYRKNWFYLCFFSSFQQSSILFNVLVFTGKCEAILFNHFHCLNNALSLYFYVSLSPSTNVVNITTLWTLTTTKDTKNVLNRQSKFISLVLLFMFNQLKEKKTRKNASLSWID